MSNNPDQIREQIERTRADLSSNVNTLADTVNPALGLIFPLALDRLGVRALCSAGPSEPTIVTSSPSSI